MAKSRAECLKILGLSDTATEEEIKKAYRQKARELHPDKNHNDPKATGRFQNLQKAYQTLTVLGPKKDDELPKTFGAMFMGLLRSFVCAIIKVIWANNYSKSEYAWEYAVLVCSHCRRRFLAIYSYSGVFVCEECSRRRNYQHSQNFQTRFGTANSRFGTANNSRFGTANNSRFGGTANNSRFGTANNSRFGGTANNSRFGTANNSPYRPKQTKKNKTTKQKTKQRRETRSKAARQQSNRNGTEETENDGNNDFTMSWPLSKIFGLVILVSFFLFLFLLFNFILEFLQCYFDYKYHYYY